MPELPAQHRKINRNERRLLRRADDHHRAEMAAWGARGYEGPPPEFHGNATTAVVRTADSEIIFSLRAVSDTVGAYSDSANDDIIIERHEAVGYQQWPGPPPDPRSSNAPQRSEASAAGEPADCLGGQSPSYRRFRDAGSNFFRRRESAPDRSQLLARLADEFLAESKPLAESDIEAAAEYWTAAVYPLPRPRRPQRRPNHAARQRGPPVPESRTKKWPGF
jgi:hypothetical protein